MIGNRIANQCGKHDMDFDEEIARLENELRRLNEERRQRILGLVKAHEVFNPDQLIRETTCKIDDLKTEIRRLREEREEVLRMKRLAEAERKKAEIETRIEELAKEIRQAHKGIVEYRAAMPESEVKLLEVFGLRGHKELGPMVNQVNALQEQTVGSLAILRQLKKEIQELSGEDIV